MTSWYKRNLFSIKENVIKIPDGILGLKLGKLVVNNVGNNDGKCDESAIQRHYLKADSVKLQY